MPLRREAVLGPAFTPGSAPGHPGPLRAARRLAAKGGETAGRSARGSLSRSASEGRCSDPRLRLREGDSTVAQECAGIFGLVPARAGLMLACVGMFKDVQGCAELFFQFGPIPTHPYSNWSELAGPIGGFSAGGGLAQAASRPRRPRVVPQLKTEH
jgi:hypothetical protein